MSMQSYVSTLQGPAAEQTTQMEPIPGRELEMVRNNAGGFTFVVSPWDRLDRFLILGSESGTYYASARSLTQDATKGVLECIQMDGLRVVRRLVEVSSGGLAPKNTSALFVLALAAKRGDLATRQAAYAALPKVARTGTHLFEWVQAIRAMKGFSSGAKRAVVRWYTQRSPHSLAYQLTKYKQRGGWSHRDVLRLTKPAGYDPESTLEGYLFAYMTGSVPAEDVLVPGIRNSHTYDYLTAVRRLADLDETGVPEACLLIEKYHLPREVVPTKLLNRPEIWEALLPSMGVTALLRNLGKMSAVRLLDTDYQDKPSNPLAYQQVAAQLTDREVLRRGRVHPFQVLLAARTYAQGHGDRGKLSWSPDSGVIKYLDQSFLASMDAVQSTSTRYFLGVDISYSMSTTIAGSSVSAMEAAVAMVLPTVKSHPSAQVYGFTLKEGTRGYGPNDTELTPIHFKVEYGLQAALDLCRDLGRRMGTTDCSLPMEYALTHKIPVDVFVVYTDNETYAGRRAPSEALKAYREAMGIPARLIVVAFTATEFTIADPEDAGMLDVVGLDASLPTLIQNFARGYQMAPDTVEAETPESDAWDHAEE